MTNESEIQVREAVLAKIDVSGGKLVINDGFMVTTFGNHIVRKSFAGVVVPGGDPERGTVQVECVESSVADFEPGKSYEVKESDVTPFKLTSSFVGFDDQGRRVFDSAAWTGRTPSP